MNMAYPFPKSAYDIEGVFYISKPSPDSHRQFTFKRIPNPPLPERPPLNGTIINAYADHKGHGKVFLNQGVYHQFIQTLPLSSRVEDGGYMIGQAFRCPGTPMDENDPDFQWWILIDHVIPAKGIYGTPGMLLFTGDSWSHIHRLLDYQYKGLKLLGWYHTHLFDATPQIGLSGMDKDLHTRFLPLPWQVPLLINLNHTNDRVLRCYQKTHEGLFIETPYYQLDTTP